MSKDCDYSIVESTHESLARTPICGNRLVRLLCLRIPSPPFGLRFLLDQTTGADEFIRDCVGEAAAPLLSCHASAKVGALTFSKKRSIKRSPGPFKPRSVAWSKRVCRGKQ